MKNLLFYFALVYLTLTVSNSIAQVNENTATVLDGCATNQLHIANASLRQAQNNLDIQVSNYLLTHQISNNKLINTVITIPTVVHIIHNNGAENISNAQVAAAIQQLNAMFVSSNGTQIQFCLAQRDPQNNATNGITRTQSALTTEVMENDDIALKNLNRWNPTQYLNIWVVQEILSASMGSGVVGYAYFPSAHGLNMDGIVIEANFFGISTQTTAVLAHEVGHYLGLYHTFENGCTNNNCMNDGDKVCDTPPDQAVHSSCLPATNSCHTDIDDASSNNPFTTDANDFGENYMDYSPLACYTQFTTGQYTRMNYFLNNVRSSLLNSLGCNTPCAAPLTASITASGSTTIATGTTLNFTGTATNSTAYQYYINPSTILSTSTALTHTFATGGMYWMKFKAVSSNPVMCLDAIDSVKVIVMQPIAAACSGSIRFDDINTGVLLPLNNQYYSDVNSGYTWETWFKLDTPTTNFSVRPLISAIDGVVFEDMWLGMGWNGGWYDEPVTKLVFKVDGPNSAAPYQRNCSYEPVGGFTPNQWYHAAGVMNYTTHEMKLFVNGVLVDALPQMALPNSRAIETSLSYAWSGNVIPLYGNMDEVRIWNKPLSDTEIATYYNQCRAGTEPNLLVYYKANQTAGSTITDMTPNHLDGTLVNAAGWSNDAPSLVGAACTAACACPLLTINAGNDTTICSGSLPLNASSGFDAYIWTPAAGLNNANIQNPIATPTATTTYTVTGIKNIGNNLVYNGDFSLGNVGFTTGMNYSSIYTPCNYYIANTFFDPLYGYNITGHSLATPNMYMSIDGCSTSTIIWEQTIPVISPNTTYNFEFWATEAAVSQPHFEIHYIGNITGEVIISNQTGIPAPTNSSWIWDKYSIPIWNSGINTSVTIRIVNTEIQDNGNDFGIDDISLTQACVYTDSMTITVNNTTTPTLNLGANITNCSTATQVLDAGAGFNTYLWQDGSTAQTFTAYTAGTYMVTVTDACGNTQTDSITITTTIPAVPTITATSTTITAGQCTTLAASTPTPAALQWSNATNSTTATIVECPTATTTYTVNVDYGNGCWASSSVTVNVVRACDSSILANGGFENNTVIGSSTNLGAGATTDDWQVWLGSPQISNDAHSGSFSATMWGVSNDAYMWVGEGIVNNMVNFAPYTSYRITFYAKQANAATQPVLPTASVYIGGSTTPINVPILGTTWQPYTITWAAPATVTNTLQIKTTNNSIDNSIGNVSWLLIDDICISKYVGTENLPNTNANIVVYPNPIADYIHIKHPETVRYIQLIDVLGRILNNIAVTNQTETYIDTTNLPKGVYFIVADDHEAVKVVK